MQELSVVLNPKGEIVLEDIMAIDLETSGLRPWVDKIRLIILGTTTHVYILDPREYSRKFLIQLFEQLKDVKLIAHNAKFECSFIYGEYGVLLENWHCTMDASRILTNGKQGIMDHDLPTVLKRYLNVTHAFSQDKKLLQKSFTSDYALDRFTERQLRYASDDVKHLLPLFKEQIRRIIELKLEQIIKLESHLLPVLAKMEVEGTLIDKEGWSTLIKDKWTPKLHSIETRLDEEVERLTGGRDHKRNKTRVISYDLFGLHTEQVICSPSAINYSSATQVLDFFRELGQEVPKIIVKKKQEDGSFVESVQESVDDGALTRYLNDYPDSILKTFIKILKEYREMDKALSTYGQSFLDKLDQNNHIHTGYTQTFTATGRLSSKAPNLQNIPATDDVEMDVRRFFIAPPGYKFITCDMNSAEIAIAADYSGEQLLLDSILNGADMHSLLASTTFSIVFQRPITITKSKDPIVIEGKEYVPDNLRTVHKQVTFAKFYKAGAKRVYSVLAEYINVLHTTKEERESCARKISNAIDKQMPDLNKYLTGLIKKAQKEGFLRTSKLGRIRFFNEDVYGDAANAPIQGTNAEAIKIAMVRAHRELASSGYDARLIMNVHDELCAIAKEDIAEEVGTLIRKIVGESLSFFLNKVKGGASINITNHWKK